jgi:hypothetical protein
MFKNFRFFIEKNKMYRDLHNSILRRNSKKNTFKKKSNIQKNNSYLKSLNSRWQLFFTVMTRQK